MYVEKVDYSNGIFSLQVIPQSKYYELLEINTIYLYKITYVIYVLCCINVIRRLVNLGSIEI